MEKTVIVGKGEAGRLELTAYIKLSNLDELGRGGYGVVYKAVHPTWSEVAYKEVLFDGRENNHREDLKKEAEIQFQIQHLNIVKIFGIVLEPHHSGLILEFMANGDMKYFLNRYRQEITWFEKLKLLLDICSGMQYLHDRNPPVIHGDLKMENVLISSDRIAKISDFGFSTWKTYSKSKSTNHVRGTPAYIPPEYWKDSHLRKTEEFDIYSFGILLWVAITQEVPYKGDPQVINGWVTNGQRPDMKILPAEVSKEVKCLLETCWKDDPKDRPKFTIIKNELQEEQKKVKITNNIVDINRYCDIRYYQITDLPLEIVARIYLKITVRVWILLRKEAQYHGAMFSIDDYVADGFQGFLCFRNVILKFIYKRVASVCWVWWYHVSKRKVFRRDLLRCIFLNMIRESRLMLLDRLDIRHGILLDVLVKSRVITRDEADDILEDKQAKNDQTFWSAHLQTQTNNKFLIYLKKKKVPTATLR